MYIFRLPDKSAYWKIILDGSFEHPKHMFKLMGKEINAILGAQTILIWTFAFLTNHVYEYWDNRLLSHC